MASDESKGSNNKRRRRPRDCLVAAFSLCIGLMSSNFHYSSVLRSLLSSSHLVRIDNERHATVDTPSYLPSALSRRMQDDRKPSIVILVGPHKTGSTTTQGCMADWTVEGSKGYFDGWSWPVPSILKDWSVPKGFAPLGRAAQISFLEKWPTGPAIPANGPTAIIRERFHGNVSTVFHVYNQAMQESWNNGQRIIFGSELFDYVVGRLWSGTLMDVIMAMLAHLKYSQNNTEFADDGSGDVVDTSRPFILRHDVEVVVNYRTPRISHLKSVWHEMEANNPLHHGSSFKQFLQFDFDESPITITDSLGVALQFLRRGLKTTIIHLSGMKEEHRDICHVVACDVMKQNCTRSGHLARVPANETVSEIKNTRPDPAVGLNMTDQQLAMIDRIIFLYDCGLQRELEEYESTQQLQVLFRQHGFLDGCQANATKKSDRWLVENIRRIAAWT